MAYRIPSEAEVIKAIENCMVRTPHIRSQRMLYDIVSTELMCMDEGYRISGERIRRIGVKHGLFSLEIHYARTDRHMDMRVCPVCGKFLRSVRNMTLDGESVEVMRRCDFCGYAMKGAAKKPARYVIERRL